nr:tyrosine-type recombinase/integrase [Streptomyces boncukensis]
MIELPDATAEERKAATPLEVIRLASAVGPFFPLVVATAYTGCRWGEVTGARRASVRHFRGDNERRKGRRLYIHTRAEAGTLKDGKPRKGKSYRDLALPEWLAEIFDEQLAGHDSEYVFPSMRGKALRPKAFGEVWQPARDRIKPGFRFHDLRHSHETWMEADRTPEVLRNKRMGHKSGKMSQHYSHTTGDMEEDLMTDLTKRWQASLSAAGVDDWRRLWVPGGP